MFQERIPMREKETKRTLEKVRGVEWREHLQVQKRGKERMRIRTAAMISHTDIFKKGG